MPAFALLRTAVAAIATVAATSACADNCQLRLVASLKLTQSGDHVLVPVSVTAKQLQFEFELADAYTGITAKSAKDLGLIERSLPPGISVEIDNQPVTKRVAVPLLQIDRVTGHDLDLLEAPSLSTGDGILGLDILAAYDMELDLAHDKANLFSRYHCVGKVIYWHPPGGTVEAIPLSVQRSGNITANMVIDGIPASVAIATDDRSVMEMPVAHRIFGIDENSPGMKLVQSDKKDRPGYRYPFRAIEVQGLKIENPDIIIEGKRSDPDCNSNTQFRGHPGGTYVACYGGADLFLGVSVLKRLHLFFAFGEKMLYATAAS